MKTDTYAAQAALQGYGLSPQQRHLRRLQQGQPGDPFVVRCRVRVEGVADASALRAAVEQAAGRHEILRAPLRDARGEDAPFSTRLSHTDGGRWELLVGASALRSDAAGLRSLVGEIARLYEARACGLEPSLPEPVDYAEVARVFNELLEEEDSSAGVEFWQRQNLSAVEWGQLGFERRASASDGFAPAVSERRVGAATAERLKAAAESRGATVEQWLLACWKTLLWRLTGRTDVFVGVAFANRNYGLDDAVGLFGRCIPLRSQMTGDLPFAELVKRVAATLGEAQEWQDYFSWEHLAATGDGDSGGAAFCDFAFEYEEAQTTYTAGGATFIVEELYSCTDRFRLKLSCAAEPGGSLRGLSLHYDGAQLSAADVAQIDAYLNALLLGSLDEPHRPVSRLPLLDAEQRRRLLARMGRRDTSAPDASATLHGLFERQAARTPHAVAVVFEDEEVTYAELDARANRLAARLRRHGVGPESRVGLLLERSVEMVVAILGVLKAGGAYVPLEPAYPEERLRYVVEDAALRVVITSPGQEQRAAGLGVEKVLSADAREADGSVETDAAAEAEGVAVAVGADNLCYVIYTSGSTGRPKGVMVTHGNVARLFAVTAPLFDFRQEDVWTLFHSYAFDFSVWELWGALLYGGRLVVVPYWVSRSPDSFRKLLARKGVTVLSQTPSAFRQLVAEDERAGAVDDAPPLSLRAVVFGGEALEVGSLRPWVRRYGDERPRLINMYGITETTVHVTYSEVTAEEVEAGGASRIGEGLGDLSVYVLDERGEVVGAGMAGEMYVGGEGVARGYLNRPGLTAERFVPDPFSGEPGARLYRTGDLARVRADGGLEYLGRIDQQVKVRGHRIELGEIEAALSAIIGVREAVVEARTGPAGAEKRLVAYVVWDEGDGAAERSVPELRGRLKGRLPEYMVPSAFVELGRLPLTQNGKVDRRALPDPEEASARRGGGYEAARTPSEELLCGIWAEVLGVERVGVRDNFFELGGDSILSIQIVARAARSGLSLTPKSLFEHQTVAELAAAATPRAESAAQAGDDAARVPETGAAPLTPIQHRFFELHRSAPHHFNQSVLLSVREPLTRELLERVVGALLRQHDALRLRFERGEGGGWVQRYADYDEAEAGSVVSCHDLSGLGEAEALAAMEAEGGRLQAGLDLGEGPLMRVGYFRLNGELGGRLLIAIHHLAVDGVSWRILLEDLERAYGQARAGAGVELGGKTSSYGEWARRLAEYAGGEQVEREAGYWLAQAEALKRSRRGEGAGAARRRAEGAGRNGGGPASAAASLSEGLTRGLLQEAGRAYGTRVTEVLLAALLVAWEEWGGETALAVDVESHGREGELVGGADLTRTVGWFTAIYPLVLELPQGWGGGAGGGDYGRALKSVKERVRGVPGGGIGYGLLRYLGRDEGVRRALAEGVAARVSFNYLGQFDTALKAGGDFEAAAESAGRAHAPETEREYELGVSASVRGGRLHVGVNYDAGLYEKAEVESLVAGYVRVLGEMVEHCRAEGVGGYTPSDFPLLQLEQSQLDEAFEELEFE